MSMKYLSREIEPLIKRAAGQFPVLVLTGPRQTGKSTLLKKLFPGHRYVSLDDLQLRAAARRDPALFIASNPTPVIIDEIQYAPVLLSHIKISVDSANGAKGQFMLTGSQMFPLMAGVSESLAGRAALFELLGFSWKELKPVPKTPRDCFAAVLRGFYPVPALRKVDLRQYYSGYTATYLERDIRQIQSVQDMSVFQTFLQLLAARAGALLNLTEVSKECGITLLTARRWLSLLENTRIIYLLRPYARNITKRLVKSPKLYFTDTGLLAYLLRYPDFETLMAGPQAGAFFENMIVAEALKRKFNRGLLYELYFYRDSNGNEADLVFDFGRRQVFAEIKASKNPSEKFAGFSKHIPLNGQTAYLLSFYEKELFLSKSVKAVPWWAFDPSAI